MMLNPQINVTIVNEEKWLEFAPDTEMILNKQGRRLFPTLEYKVRGLSPIEKYCFEVQMERVDGKKYKFNGGKWHSDGDADPRRDNKVVRHPSEFTLGAHVMNSIISFEKLRITNCETNKDLPLTILLETQHRFMPILIIKKFDNRINDAVVVSKISFTFTSFYAVTAYQSDKQIELKKKFNKYAFGFRPKEGIEANKTANGRKRANVDGNSRGRPQNKRACNQMTVQQSSLTINPPFPNAFVQNSLPFSHPTQFPNQFDFMPGMSNENVAPFAHQPNFNNFAPNYNYNNQFSSFQEIKNIPDYQQSYNQCQPSDYYIDYSCPYSTYNSSFYSQNNYYNQYPNNFPENTMYIPPVGPFFQPDPIQPVQGQSSLNTSPPSSYTPLN